MKVLIVTSWYPSKFHPANGDFIMYQTKGLINEDIEAAVIYANLDYKLIRHPKYIRTRKSFAIEDGIPTFRLTGFFMPKLSLFLLKKWSQKFETLYLNYLEKYGSPDILHAHTFLGGYVAWNLSKKYGIPYLITEHFTGLLNGQVKNWWKPLMQKVYSNAAFPLAVGTGLKEKMERNYCNKTVTYLPNFIDTKLFDFKPKNKDTPFTFISVGELIPRKGFDLLLQSFQLLIKKGIENVKLIIVGGGPEKTKLEKLAFELEINNKVKFTGRCSQQEVASYLQQSEVFVSSSRLETFGIAIVEAMACGLPVISSDCFGPRDIVNSTTGVIVPIESVSLLTNAMKNMITDKKRYSAQKIRQYAVDHFGQTAVVGRLKQLYKSAIERNQKNVFKA